jgi:hypothetical protein
MLVAFSTSAAADSGDWPSDPRSWNTFCIGFLQEIKAQAEEGNNQVQFNEAVRLSSALSFEYVWRLLHKEWTLDEHSWYAFWLDHGAQSAGRDFWNRAGGDAVIRGTIIDDRRAILDKCSSLAETASLLKQLSAHKAKR